MFKQVLHRIVKLGTVFLMIFRAQYIISWSLTINHLFDTKTFIKWFQLLTFRDASTFGMEITVKVAHHKQCRIFRCNLIKIIFQICQKISITFILIQHGKMYCVFSTYASLICCLWSVYMLYQFRIKAVKWIPLKITWFDLAMVVYRKRSMPYRHTWKCAQQLAFCGLL